MANTNVVNQELNCRDYNLEDILGVVYTNQVVKVVKNETGELEIKIRRNRLKIFSIIYTLIFGLISCLFYFNGGTLLLAVWIVMFAPALFFFQYALGKIIQDLILKRIFFITRDEMILQFVISSSNYKECDEYINNLF